MLAFLSPWRACVGALAAVLVADAMAAPTAESLSFQRAQAIAERAAPENLASAAQAESARYAVGPADALPDPRLTLGVDNLPIEGPDRYSLSRDRMTMRRIGVMQEVPNGDKRAARRQLAEAGASRAVAEQRAVLLQTRRQTAQSWLQRYYSERSLALFDELDEQVALLRATVQSLIAGGSAQPGDLLRADQEALSLQDRRDALERDAAMARAELRRWVGDAAGLPLAGEPPPLRLALPGQSAQLSELPALRAASARVGEAQAGLAEAVADKTPDWGVELAYKNRDQQFGDMLMLQFSFDLPLFVGSRQGPRIAAREHRLAQSQAEQEALRRGLQAELERGRAELAQLSKAARRSEGSAIPLARQRSDLELAAYRAGKGSLAAVIAARRELIEARLRLIDQQRRLSQLQASLYYAYVEGLQ